MRHNAIIPIDRPIRNIPVVLRRTRSFRTFLDYSVFLENSVSQRTLTRHTVLPAPSRDRKRLKHRLEFYDCMFICEEKTNFPPMIIYLAL